MLGDQACKYVERLIFDNELEEYWAVKWTEEASEKKLALKRIRIISDL